jgi:hypothetical protein
MKLKMKMKNEEKFYLYYFLFTIISLRNQKDIMKKPTFQIKLNLI